MEGESAALMKAYRVSGIAPFGQVRQAFSLDLVADSTVLASEHAYSILGSRHRATRRSITIQSINEIDPRTSTEPRILHAFREQIAAQGGLIAVSEEE